MKFHKMQGAGNDFIVLNNLELKIPADRFSAMVLHLCRRRISLGADALMILDAPEGDGDFRMLFFNADGSEGEMCGNGARCLARYAYEQGVAGDQMKFETRAGLVEAWRISRRDYRVKLNSPEVVELSVPLEVEGRRLMVDYVELGRPGLPHVVVDWESLGAIPEDELRRLAQAIRFHPRFPKGANVNFCRVIGLDRVLAQTFERGVEDFTLACGTGSGSMALTLKMRGRVAGERVGLTVPGGELFIEIKDGADGRVELFLIGQTNLVAEGRITDEDGPDGIFGE